MPRIIIEASSTPGAAGERTFSERIVTQNLQSGHYSAQLLERLIWAVADAEAAEAGPTGPAGAQPAVPTMRAPAPDSLYVG